ncbi:hypothetical protein [Burkholderia pseudomultivorans]|uniref:hypothetical protein n=1 Tax=Burkholderia pseudomultivorans TaxID=1207504 RepID=UPI00189027D4|nr:hypothetical protein [Burkholderia pseudomultivorans]MBF5008721.1 hypothetical protein [Burkholderia pseudomultivorans]
MSASRENMLRALKERDAARKAYRAGNVDQDVRLAAAEAGYDEAERQYREIQREKIVAGVVFAFTCGALGLAMHFPPWGVVALFLGGVGAVKLLTL